jgi:hypothetical protein
VVGRLSGTAREPLAGCSAGHHNWCILDQRVVWMANLGDIPSPRIPRTRFHRIYRLAFRYRENMAPLNNCAHVTLTLSVYPQREPPRLHH